MRKILVSVLLVFIASATSWAQMTEDRIIQYVLEQQEKGMSQEQIVYNLSRRGVTVQQLQSMREKYEKQQATGVLGNTVPMVDGRPEQRVRERSQTLNLLQDDPSSVQLTERERLLQMYDEAMFMFTDSLLLLKQQLFPPEKEIWGHSIFSNKNLSFEPSMNLPTPQNYRLGPGDEVIIDIWGVSQNTIREVISPDGNIMVEGVGPVYLNGLTIQAADRHIKRELSQIYFGLDKDDSGSNIKLTLGQARSIQVNVLGEVENPGTYMLSSFATVFNALYMAGGVTEIGSMRDVRLYRNNREVAKIDFYDYLQNGILSDDIRLYDNDVVMVLPHSMLVNISGRVRRPMYYEMKDGESISTLLDYAGGLESDAYRNDIRVIRMGEFQREIFTVSKDRQADFLLADGDSLYVDSIKTTFSNMAEIRGAVFRPGQFQIDGEITTVRALIEAAGGLCEDAFPSRALLSRTNPDKTLTNLAIDIQSMVNGNVPDEPLRNDDVLFIPSLFDIGEIKTISIYGEVMFPGVYRYADNTAIEDLILQAGGLKETASIAKVDVVRRKSDKNAFEKSDELSETISFSIDENLSLNDGGFTLMPFDEVYVRRSPGYALNRRVIVEGEVVFPGHYSLSTNNERLSDIVTRAGLFSNQAYPAGARLERKMTDEERIRMRKTVETLSANDSLALAKTLEKLMEATTIDVGINLQEAIDNPGGADDIILRDGDRLIIPPFANTVKINGAVMFSNTTPYVKGKSLAYYIDKAGGFAQKAKKNKAYVVYMNGSVAKGRKASTKLIQPGCEIIVPTKEKREGMSTSEILSLSSTSASLATVVLALINLLK